MRPSARRVAAFIVASLAVAALWLVALPAASRTPLVERLNASSIAAGFDPGAIFYSELAVAAPPRGD